MVYGNQPLFNPGDLFAIGDVHGDADKLRDLLAIIEPKFTSTTHLVFCGDLFDVGPNVIGVWEIVIRLRKQYPGQIYIVMGNHEIMLMMYLAGRDMVWSWGQRWGKTFLAQTLAQWGSGEQAFIADEFKKRGYGEVLVDLLPYYETPEVLVTHAALEKHRVDSVGGLDEETQEGFLARMSEDSLYWNFVDEVTSWSGPPRIPELKKYLINGHQRSHGNRPRQYAGRCFLDTGCGYKPTSPLAAVHYPTKKIFLSSDK
jgi:hypothetical protein